MILDYNCERSESREYKLIFQFRKFIWNRQTRYDIQNFRYYNCRGFESKRAHANTIIFRQGVAVKKMTTPVHNANFVLRLKMWKDLNDAVWRNAKLFVYEFYSSATQSLCKAKVNFLRNGWMHRNFNTNMMCMHLPMVHTPKTYKWGGGNVYVFGCCVAISLFPRMCHNMPWLLLPAVYNHTQFSVTALSTWSVVHTSKVCATAMLTLWKVRYNIHENRSVALYNMLRLNQGAGLETRFWSKNSESQVKD